MHNYALYEDCWKCLDCGAEARVEDLSFEECRALLKSAMHDIWRYKAMISGTLSKTDEFVRIGKIVDGDVLSLEFGYTDPVAPQLMIRNPATGVGWTFSWIDLSTMAIIGGVLEPQETTH